MDLSILFSSLLLSCVLFASSTDAKYNAVFSFGDSFADTGNFVILESQLLPVIPIDLPPYGMTFFGHPTGRCSNGRLIIDFICESLGLPFLPPSLSHNESFTKGANFAVVGATALDLAFFQENNITGIPPIDSSLSVQLGWFDALKPSLCKTTRKCKNYMKKSLFFVGEFGGNDYNFLLTSGKTLDQVIETYVPKVIDVVYKAVEKLIGEGAATVVVPGNVPTGCIPAILTLFASPNKTDYDPQTGCLKKFNELGKHHNLLLLKAVEQLRKKYLYARIIYADYYAPVIEFASKPTQFGFSNGAIKACCGGGGPYNYNVSAVCGLPGVSACKDPSTYANWDGIHLTEASYSRIATGWLKGPYAHPPIQNLSY
ncbi:GDSL esterase/lipase At5g45910-like [Ananas comosus]|uniref:GDSL esterase/lipase n=1 Tax=Ananas comosus TaxID=4615 RepID=A0A199VZV8_ANACO|nr:GDSL esterase/lipase At5g45910-like [Ananas comosus]OAY82531.1 GDSL esterase/lipase [Ananas comosus]